MSALRQSILILLLMFPAVAWALDPWRDVTEYAHQSWQDGLPQDTVHTIVQTPDGYVWFGTHEGLVRFDGAYAQRELRWSWLMPRMI